ncbi:hypothetical protein B4O97_03440 [Marispirochaeta aestuarii]|uniref:Baseplate J-like central domain-containing protein n=1 Tax=Marispirochaeta aestuarii TaxID=1963862 RepID=A0A1Y1S2G0_9SPIO|nr:baseplate J/gp47 family protein [Marispirochaeta aestuarii]ORC37256.1 hypothetical protein B4O97_03440 [Marispirochaeta aestuarii]
MITIPTIAEIRDQILSDIETQTGQEAPLLPRAVWRVLAAALAGALHLLYRVGAWLYDQIFTATMDDDALSLRGQEYGLTRTPAQKWIGTATVTGSGATIAIGTLFQDSGNVYQVTDALTFTTTGTLKLESLEGGEAVHLDVADTLSIVTPQAGVDNTITVASVTQSGADQETLSAFRSRILYRQQNIPQGGSVADYVLWATEVSGIAEAFAFQPSAGFVNIYPLLDVDDPADRIPDSTKLTEVENYVSDPERKPLNAQVSAVAFSELNFDVDISNLSPNTAAVKAAIETAIENYMYSRRPLQYDDQPNDLHTVSQVEIAKITADAGALVATVVLKNAGGSSIASYELDDSELAVLRTLSWV